MNLDMPVTSRRIEILPVLLCHGDAGWLTAGDIELTVTSTQLSYLVPKGQAIVVWQPESDAFVAGLSPIDCQDHAHRFGWIAAIPHKLYCVEFKFEWRVPGMECLIHNITVDLRGVSHQTQLHVTSRSLRAGKLSQQAHSNSSVPPERWITKASFCEAPNELSESETRALLRREQLQFRELL